MARCRMLSESIMRSENFLSMTLGAQSLYVQLCIEADDEGFVSSVARTTRLLGLRKSVIKELVDNKFLIIFESSGVSVVCHWCIHNKVKKNRIRETIYQEEKSKVCLNKQKIYVLCDKNAKNLSYESLSSRTKTGQKEVQNQLDLSDQVKLSEVKSSEVNSSESKLSDNELDSSAQVATVEALEGLTDLKIDCEPTHSLKDYELAFEEMKRSSFAQQTILTLNALHKQFNRLIMGEYRDFKKESSEKPKLMKQSYTKQEIQSAFIDIDNLDLDKIRI
ncbi:MAG: hypothetical protein IJ033_03475 [Clostridia bacterium]|nr:hypothetical protein [Clostridia bacterium]